MEEIFAFMDNLTKRLSRPINDLDDVRSSMAALAEIRDAEIRSVFYLLILVRKNSTVNHIFIWLKILQQLSS